MRRLSELFCAVLCITAVHSDTHTQMSSSYSCLCSFRFLFVICVSLIFCVFFMLLC